MEHQSITVPTVMTPTVLLLRLIENVEHEPILQVTSPAQIGMTTPSQGIRGPTSSHTVGHKGYTVDLIERFQVHPHFRFSVSRNMVSVALIKHSLAIEHSYEVH